MNVGRPFLDAHPIAPPPLPKETGARTDAREWRTSLFQGGIRRDNIEVPILQTEGEWDGCDVYVIPSIESIKNQGAPSLKPNGLYRFKVYAIVDGLGKSLLATGLVCPGHLQTGQNRPILAVQARGARCKYEVDVAYVAAASGASQNWPVSFSLVASNDLAEASDNAGVSRASYDVMSAVEQALPMGLEDNQATIPANDPMSEWEIVKVRATNTNAAERTLMLFDLGPTGGPAPAAVPQLEFAIPPGQTLEFSGPFGQRFGRLGLHAGVSTTAGAYAAAAAGDILYQVFLR